MMMKKQKSVEKRHIIQVEKIVKFGRHDFIYPLPLECSYIMLNKVGLLFSDLP